MTYKSVYTGLATTELVNTMLQALPPLGPVFLLIKEFLKAHSLTDAFTGSCLCFMYYLC